MLFTACSTLSVAPSVCILGANFYDIYCSSIFLVSVLSHTLHTYRHTHRRRERFKILLSENIDTDGTRDRRWSDKSDAIKRTNLSGEKSQVSL